MVAWWPAVTSAAASASASASASTSLLLRSPALYNACCSWSNAPGVALLASAAFVVPASRRASTGGNRARQQLLHRHQHRRPFVTRCVWLWLMGLCMHTHVRTSSWVQAKRGSQVTTPTQVSPGDFR